MKIIEPSIELIDAIDGGQWQSLDYQPPLAMLLNSNEALITAEGDQ